VKRPSAGMQVDGVRLALRGALLFVMFFGTLSPALAQFGYGSWSCTSTEFWNLQTGRCEPDESVPEPPPPPPRPSPTPTGASSCTPPQFWNTWDERCDIYLCAEGWTLSGASCLRDSDGFWVPAAQCEIGSGVACDWQGMRFLDASSPSTIVRAPAPPGTIRPADPPDATVQATYTLPFTVSESGAGETSYEFSVASTTDVSVSLTGMDRDIDCSVDGFRCTNRGGTADDSWSGTLGAGTHTVSVYPYGGGSGSWTLSVNGSSSSPPPAPTPSPPGSPPPTCPSGSATSRRRAAANGRRRSACRP